jgi:oligoendopeptidase F
VCFKDYPRTAKADIKEIKVGTDLPEWDLSYLYADYKDKRIFADLNNALKMSESFKKKYENPLTKEKLSATQLNKAIIEYESVLQKMILPEGYLANKHSIELGNEELNALLGKAEIISAQIAKNVSFFENGLSRTSANYKKKIFKDKTLIVYANFLDKQAARQKHILPEDHEQLLIDKDVNGVSAWSKFRTIFESKYSFQFQGPEDKSPRAYTLSELTNLLQNDKRDVRQLAADMIHTKFGEDAYVYAQIYNSIIQDMLLIDKNRRGYYPLITERNLDSQLDNKIVEKMHKVVADNFKVAQRYWKLKAKILGIKDFNNADVMAPYVPKGKKDKSYNYTEALKILQETFDQFYKPFGGAFENVYRCGLVDAKPKPGKSGGAYCSSFGAAYPPVILTNFQGKFNDISTIAHEGGHWIHFLLIAEHQSLINSDVPKATAETASVFNEMLLASRMIKENEKDPEELLSFLMGKLDSIFATVFRQTVFSNYEQAVFKASENGPLTPDQFSQIFVQEYGKLFGDAVKMTPNFKNEWARIPHFMRPFYVYSYAFGELATLSMYQKYLDNPNTFPKKYMEKFLSAGSSLPPEKLFKTVDIDLKDEQTWQLGFKYISTLIDKVEAISQRAQ